MRRAALCIAVLAALAAARASTAAPTSAELLYATHCALCHGAQGQGGLGFPRAIWGPGSDLARFGTAQGLFEYLLLMMPFDDPCRLGPEQKQSLALYLLQRHHSDEGRTARLGWDGRTPIR